MIIKVEFFYVRLSVYLLPFKICLQQDVLKKKEMNTFIKQRYIEHLKKDIM